MAFRQIGAIGIVAATLACMTTAGAEPEWRTVSSLIGPSRYEQNFQRYDHVNPDAPKGGTLRLIAFGTFDSFNPFIVRGTPAAGLAAFGGGLLYDTLMTQSLEEPGTSYPLIAEAFSYPDDFSSATYRLDPRARFHDGTPITAADVIWSLEVLKAENPRYNQYFHNVVEAVADNDHQVTFRFNESNNRELPHIMGDLPVIPRHWWEGTGASGTKRDITRPTLEPPLGSGPYRIKSFRAGSEIVWERVPDYWASELPVNVGRYNFSERRYTYFLDENAAWQAFIKGGIGDLRFENRAQRWATEYNFPAYEAGDVVKKAFPQETGEPMQAFILNSRRKPFDDRRVREAFTLAFDFESMNSTLFYGLYKRTSSYFQGTELASRGLPEGRELEILEEYRGRIPDELFEKPFELPVYSGDSRKDRAFLARATELLREAGYTRSGNRLVDADGRPLTVEFLGNDQSDERIAGPFIAQLRRIGIEATLRIVDQSQYINRVRDFQFDIVTSVMQQSLSPGNEQRDYWGSAAADSPGSYNLMGIKNPVIDELVERVIFASDREELIALTRALDRILLWNYYVVPQWHNPEIWVAWWDRFGMPETQPAYVGIDIESWWIDPEKAARIARNQGRQN